jgi:hypothetical protein
MHLRDALRHTTADFTAGNAVTWIGPPGFGKTFNVRSLCAWMKKAYAGKKVGRSTIFMATQSPIGFSGLPWKGQLEYNGKQYTITDPAIPQWFIAFDLETGQPAPADQFDKVLLVIEEWGQGDAETKRAGAELLNAGGAGKFYLPKGSFRLALSNNDTRDGITKEFDFVINRRGQYQITGDVDVWIEDFADKPQNDGDRVWQVMPVVKAWAKQHPEVLFEPKPKEQGPWCTPRSLTMADRYSQVMAEMNSKTPGVIPIEDNGFVEGLAGKIGMPAATSLINHMRFQIELPHYEDVVADPSGTEVPTKPDLMMLMAYELAGRCKVPDLAPVLQYVSRFKAKDMHITFVSSLLRRDYKAIINEPAMQAWVAKNAQLVSIIASLSQ